MFYVTSVAEFSSTTIPINGMTTSETFVRATKSIRDWLMIVVSDLAKKPGTVSPMLKLLC